MTQATPLPCDCNGKCQKARNNLSSGYFCRSEDDAKALPSAMGANQWMLYGPARQEFGPFPSQADAWKYLFGDFKATLADVEQREMDGWHTRPAVRETARSQSAPMVICNTHGFVGPGFCPRCTPSSTRAKDDICWLIERSQLEGQVPTMWFSGDPTKNTWTEDANFAKRYKTAKEAEADANLMFARFDGDPRRACHVSEHVFVDFRTIAEIEEMRTDIGETMQILGRILTGDQTRAFHVGDLPDMARQVAAKFAASARGAISIPRDQIELWASWVEARNHINGDDDQDTMLREMREYIRRADRTPDQRDISNSTSREEP